MPFAYRELTISGGSDPTLEGTSRFIQDIKNVLVNDMGWTLTEDRSDQAGTDHKVILQSNGEDDDKSTFYVVLTSGTTDEIGIQAATFWDTGTHTTGSGVANPTNETSVTLETDEDADYTGWISGNRDSVVLLSKVGSTYDAAYVGRILQITDPVQDPFPVFCVGTNVADVDTLAQTTANIYSFLDGVTVIANNDSEWGAVFITPLDANQHPNNIFGSTESYVAFPIIAGVANIVPLQRSTRGFSANMWVTIGPSATGSTLSQEDELEAAENRTYKAFFDSGISQRAVLIRKS